MKTYTEEDLRLAFGAGLLSSENYKIGSAQKLEDEYIESLNHKEVEEETVSFTYSYICRKLDWEEFCEISGIDYYLTRYGREVIKDHETFEIKESTAKQYGLL